MTDSHETSEPLVSVVTPVYNGASYLASCIESVLEQSYQNFEYIILNNASTDESAAIMTEYSKMDKRIKIENNKQTLPMMENWNHALSLISAESKYCKVVHADDLLLPTCLEKMTAVAEEHPQATLVGAYRITGNSVGMDSVPYPEALVSGKKLARGRLLTREYRDQFGTPTSVMYRADCVRSAPEFYDTNNIHADTQSCLQLLSQGDYAFVHDVLTYTRRHDESQTSAVEDNDTRALGHLKIQKKIGPLFLTESEQQQAMNQRLRSYYQRMARNFRYLRKKPFRDYHRAGFVELDQKFSIWRLSYALVLEVVSKALVALRGRG